MITLTNKIRADLLRCAARYRGLASDLRAANMHAHAVRCEQTAESMELDAGLDMRPCGVNATGNEVRLSGRLARGLRRYNCQKRR